MSHSGPPVTTAGWLRTVSAQSDGTPPPLPLSRPPILSSGGQGWAGRAGLGWPGRAGVAGLVDWVLGHKVV